jgi:Sulfotransferase domain
MSRTTAVIGRQVPRSVRASLLTLTGRSGRRYDRPAPFPTVPASWEVGPPDFVGIGVQKAGTSWWHSLLLQHPQVVPACASATRPVKELHFFDRFWDGRSPTARPDTYARYFPRPDGLVAGEWTPRYMADPWAVPLLAEVAPQAKLLVMLRDPVERYVSGLTHSLVHGMRRNAHTAAEAYHRGFYAAQLRHVYAHVPRSQVLVLQYERCRVEPAAELDRTLRFLGLGHLDAPPAFDQAVNTAQRAKEVLAPQVRESLMSAYQPDLLALRDLAPEIDLTLWGTFRGSPVGTAR